MARRVTSRPYILPKFTGGMWRESRDVVANEMQIADKSNADAAGMKLPRVGGRSESAIEELCFCERTKMQIDKSPAKSMPPNN